MYINSNHIRVTKLIQTISNPDLNFFSELLKTSEQNTTLYIRDVYKYISPNCTTFKKNIMLKSIRENKNLIDLLKKEQEITKEERICFIIFSLFLKREVNLSELANFLSVTRRSLNYDILEIKKVLNQSNLEILSLNSKGVKLIGHEDDILRIFHAFLFKIVIELQETPEKIKKIYNDYLKKRDYSKILKDSKTIISKMSLNKYFHIDIIFSTFILSFINYEIDQLTLKNLSDHHELYLYFKNDFSLEETEIFFNAIQNNIFGDFPLSKIHSLILFLKLSNGSLYLNDPEIQKKYSELKDFFKDKLKIVSSEDEQYMFYLGRIVFFTTKAHSTELKDLSFLSLNIGNNLSEELIDIFLELRKTYKNINFSELLNLYFYITDARNHKEKFTSDIYLLYKNIPEQMFQIIKNRLNKIYSINLLGFVDINIAGHHLKTNKTDCFIILETFDYTNPEIEVRYLPFPL
ncbi:MAG: helix-turn-helix domain-containing protein [Fusobacteriaceae bacterium]